MALELRFYTLVMRKEKVAHLLKEEILLYEANRLKDLTLQTFQCDQHLASYGAMAANYFDDFINDLLKLGLKERADFEIVDGFRNGQHAWLEILRKDTNFCHFLTDEPDLSLSRLPFIRLDLQNYISEKTETYVCPKPILWNNFYNQLLTLNKNEKPALPLILAAWWEASNLEKNQRFQQHLQWAYLHKAEKEVRTFIESLRPDDWHTWND